MNTTKKMSAKFLFFIVFLAILNVDSFGYNDVIIAGKIEHSESFLANIKYYEDHLEEEEIFIGGILDKGDSFRVQFKIFRPTLIRVEHGVNKIELYLEPGDSIHIHFDNWELKQSLKFTGNPRPVQQNRYLRAVAKEMHIYLSDINSMHFSRDLNEIEYQEHAEMLKKKQLRFLKEHQKKTTFSPAFLNYALSEIEYNWAASLLNYPIYHQFFNNLESPVILDEKYYKFLKKLNYKDLSDLNSLAFRSFLDAFINYQLDHLENPTNVLHRYFYKNRINTIREYLSGAALDYMLAETFISAYQRGQLYDLARDVEDFLMSDALESYKDVIDKFYKLASTLRPGREAPNFQLENLASDTVTLADLKGKVVYIDFWATWCGPCKTEIDYSKAIKEKFPENEVVFVYISLDDETDKDIWKWYVQQNHIEGLHLIASGAFKSQVAQDYNVTGVPTFYLINRDGKIASNTPKRPSQLGLEQEIQAILNFPGD
jgi:thiol-disulfide isomerase/thioredoxin